MFFTGGPATMRMPGMTEKIERKAFEFGYSLGQAGIELESPEALRLTGHFVMEMVMGFAVEFLFERALTSALTDNDLCRQLDPEAQEAVREIRQEVYAGVVRRGIEDLGKDDYLSQLWR
jgi:hypothetical protein